MNPTADRSRLRAQIAVLGILRDLGVPAGEPVFVGEVARRWADCGIRGTDLIPALDDLAGSGLIARSPETSDQVAATPKGQAWLHDQPAWMEYLLLVPRASHAAFLRQWRNREAGPAPRRRREDAQADREVA